MTKEKVQITNNHHLFNKKEIRENLVRVIGEPKTDEEHRRLQQLVMKVWRNCPQFKIDAVKHYELTYHKIPRLGKLLTGKKKESKSKERRRLMFLERHITRQKTYITQLLGRNKELEFLFLSKKKESLNDLYELFNNLQDDLTVDKDGEFGYKDEKEVVNAIKKYTKSVLNRKIRKWEKLVRVLPIKEYEKEVTSK